MQDVSHAIKQLSEIQFPEGLHGRIMRQLLFLKFRTPFLVITSLLVANLVVNGWRLWERLLEEQAPLLFSILFDNAEMTAEFFVQVAQTTFDVVPLPVAVALIINALALWYIARLPARFAKMEGPSYSPSPTLI